MTPFGRARRQQFDRTLDGLAVGVLVVVAAAAALTFRDYGLGWDDYTHAQYGALLLKLYSSGFANREALHFVNLYYYGGGFDMGAALLAKVLPFSLFETRRLAGALVGLVGLAATWRIGRRLGGPLAGFLAVTLLALCPLYYGHMFINAKDAPFAAAMAVLLLGLVRAFDDYPRPRIATVVLVGIGLGLAIGSRVLAGLVVLYMTPPLILLWLHGAIVRGGTQAAARDFGRFVLALLPALAPAIAIMALLWPWSVLEPLNIVRAGLYFSHFFERPWRELFAGELILVPDMPRVYVPLLLALKLPEVTLALGLGGLVYALGRATHRDMPVGARAALLLIVGAAAWPVLVAVVTRPAMYNGIRHFLFILPPFAALGGLAGARLLEWLHRRARIAFAAGAVLLAAGLALPLAELVRLHPYQYIHFNRLVGGIRGAESRFMLDYWGLSFKQAAQALRAWLAASNTAPPAGRRWRVAVCGPHPPVHVELGPDFELTWNPRNVDFVLALGVFYCVPVAAPRIAAVEREGVVLARLYDARGRTIPRILTIPPPDDSN